MFHPLPGFAGTPPPSGGETFFSPLPLNIPDHLSDLSDCVFCQIVEGTAPASVVYSDGSVMAFMDIAPIVPGHLLAAECRLVFRSASPLRSAWA